jgi:uncharacterized protein YndB with AHSA1/START domain
MAASTTSAITIAAPPPEVMAVIADFGAYPQWATAVRSARILEHNAGGRASRVRFELDAGVVRDSYVLGYTWDGDAGVRWRLAEPGAVISVLDGQYLLTDLGGKTRVVYELTVDLRIPLPGLLKRRAEKTIVDTALAGLKRRVEAGRGDSR